MKFTASILVIWILSFDFVSAQPDKPFYEISIDLSPAKHALNLEGEMDIPAVLAVNSSLVLLHSPGATSVQIQSEDADSVTISANGRMAQYLIHIPEDTDKEDSITVNLSFDIEVPVNHPQNRITPDWIELNIDSFWLPLVSSIPNIDYKVTVDLGGDYSLISGDRYEKKGEGIYSIRNYIPRRDIPFSAGKNIRSFEGELSESYSILEEVNLQNIVEKADSILYFLKGYTGEDEDFKEPRRIVITPREESGYSRKNYIALSDIRSMEDSNLSGYLAHEFAHYWFSNANFQSRHHWLSESFAEYLSMIYMTSVYGDDWLNKVLIEKQERAKEDTTKIADFERRPSMAALYHRGPLVLHAFHSKVGDEAFKQMIRAFIEADVRTNDDLLDVVRDELGADAADTIKNLMAEI